MIGCREKTKGLTGDSILPRREVTTLAHWKKKGQCGGSTVSEGREGDVGNIIGEVPALIPSFVKLHEIPFEWLIITSLTSLMFYEHLSFHFFMHLTMLN